MNNRKGVSSLINSYLISIIPLIIYSLYKNIYLVLINDDFSLIYFINYILILTVPIILILSYNYYKEKTYIINYTDLPYIFISLFIGVNFNVFIYTLLLIITYFTEKKLLYKFNYTIVFKLVLVLILTVLSIYSYSNPSELINTYNFNTFDLIMGRSVGGIASSSLIFGMLSYFILQLNMHYKKYITIITISVYSLLVVLLSLFINVDFENIGGIFLCVTLISSFSIYTPVKYKMQTLYSVLLAILTVIFNILFNYQEGIFIATLIVQMSYYILIKTKVFKKEIKKNQQ